jgi:hypothetical protein
MTALALAAVGVVGVVGHAGATPAVPYTDPNAVGYVGICNQQNQQITSGSIHSTPFAWKVVSSLPAPKAVSGAGRTSALYAYQPIKGLPSGYWSGVQITDSSVYADPAHPTAVSTAKDTPLSQFLVVFPPKWDGFVQLRLFLDAPGVQPAVLTYPALNLNISGDTWQAMGGGSVDCSSGQAVSKAVELPSASAAPTGSAASSSSQSSATGSGSASGSGAKSGTANAGGSSASNSKGSGATGAGGTLPVAAESKSSNVGQVIILVAVVVILSAIAAGLVLRIRRRRSLP